MTYPFLAAPLHHLADEAKKFMRTEWGISESKIKVEVAVSPDVRGRPTLQAQTKDHQIICIEITETSYPPQIDPFVIDCKNQGLPVKLYVGIPAADTIPQKTIALFRASGIGLIVIGARCQEIHPALSLSLTGVRNPDAKTFPPKYRQTVTDAYRTFLNGDPVNGGLAIYQEIENLTRKLCNKTTQKGWWNAGAPKPPNASDPKIGFKKIAKFVATHFDKSAAKMPAMDGYLLDAIVAAARPRNDQAHKPSTPQALKKRHQELRTRFESGVDLLRDFVKAAKNRL